MKEERRQGAFKALESPGGKEKGRKEKGEKYGSNEGKGGKGARKEIGQR